MAHRALPLLLLGLLVGVAGCVAPADDEDAALDEALSGGRDLDSFAAGSTEQGDVAGVKFVGAADSALQVGRPGEIDYVVIHDVEGAGRSAVNTFRRSGNESSAHYVVDKNGVSVQTVREENIANHAFHTVFNAYAIGVEHAGFAAENGYTRAEYDESARIVASIVTRYRIPIDRAHIVGHHQVPKSDPVTVACPENARDCGGQGGHTDPGPNWDWSLYMTLVADKARALGYVAPTAAEQATRALTAVDPVQTLSPSKRLFGGYYATQCDAVDPTRQTIFRTINKSTESARLESRYLQARVGECGTKADGIYPLILRGFPTHEAPRLDLDLRGVSIDTCVDHARQVFRFEGASVRSSRAHGGKDDPVLALVSRAEGC
jgi:N-acetyl-anhydromuramyl-L-alanine amidase AmpD